jgi:hypothetical protein
VLTGIQSDPIVSKFDWYRATVPAHHGLLLDRLTSAIGNHTLDQGKGRFNYHERTSICIDGEAVVNVLHGGPNGHPNVESSGDNAPLLAGFLREAWPDHRVTRADVAIDMVGPDLFNSMVRLIGKFADSYRLNCTSVINRDPTKGDTYYLGSRSSAVFIRCYEKGKQLQHAACPGRSLGWDHWVRLELESKPLKPFRLEAAKLEPSEYWGLAAWTRELVKEAVAMDVKPLQMRPQRVADHERAMRFLASQYGPTLLRHLDRCGGDEAEFAADLLARVRGDGEYADDTPRIAEFTPGSGWRRAAG